MKLIKIPNSSKPIKTINNYVFVVTEDATKEHPDGWIHGIYINRAEANGKFYSLLNNEYPGLGQLYDNSPFTVPFHILKLPVHGKNVEFTFDQIYPKYKLNNWNKSW